jgi:hypothetical protein
MVTAVSATTITTYTDFTSWEAAAGTYILEDFADDILVSGLNFNSTSGGEIIDGYLYDRPTSSNGGTTWYFDVAVNSFGGLFDLSPGGAGMGLLLTMTDGITLFYSPEINANTNNFWGIITDISFTSVTIASGTQGGIAETYHLDNLVYAETSPVPEPATMLLFGTGLAGLIGSRVRRGKK